MALFNKKTAHFPHPLCQCVDSVCISAEIDSTEELRCETIEKECTCHRLTSDVRLILHTKDLANRAGLSVASKFGQSNSVPSAIQQALDQMSDDDILSMVRSRHIQTPSEILAYSKSISEEVKLLEDKYKALAEQVAAESAATASAATASAATESAGKSTNNS